MKSDISCFWFSALEIQVLNFSTSVVSIGISTVPSVACRFWKLACAILSRFASVSEVLGESPCACAEPL